MGYTHYWSFKKPARKKGEAERVDKLYKKALLECQRVCKAYNKEAEGLDRLSGFSAHTRLGQYGGLKVNGKQEMQHEDFFMHEHYRDALEETWTFCKTAQKPYDVVVVACLAILKYRLGDLIRVSSDGSAAEWHAGVQLARTVLNRKIPNPIPGIYQVKEVA